MIETISRYKDQSNHVTSKIAHGESINAKYDHNIDSNNQS